MSDKYRAFIVDHTAITTAGALPEIPLRLATEITPLWTASAEDLADAEIEPPFWAFAWAGGVGLARWVLDHPEVVRGRVVLDLGAGSGVVGIAAKKSGARQVLAADVDPVALVATQLNAELNGVEVDVVGRDLLDDARVEADVVLVGDLFYDAEVGPRVLAALLRWTAPGDGRGVSPDGPRRDDDRGVAPGDRPIVMVGDPGRGYLPDATHLEAVDETELPTSLDLESAASKRVRVFRLRRPSAG